MVGCRGLGILEETEAELPMPPAHVKVKGIY